MAALQFIHINGYGWTPGRGRDPHETISGMTAEAARSQGNAPHVRYPQEPRIVYGVSPTEAGRQALRLSHLARDRRGRRLKSDGVVLVAGVATYPIPVVDMGGFVSDHDAYNLWVSRTLEWLLKEHGGSLVSVVEHTDEGHLHLHFFTLPQLAPDNRLDFDLAHPGRKALNAAVEKNAQPAAQQAAYTNAMVDWQDRYHREVSLCFGHDRYGPRRKRLDRARHRVNREAEANLSRLRAELELDYWAPVSEQEAQERSHLVSKSDFIAAAAERQQQLQKEIDRLRTLLRDHGIDERDAPTPPPQPQSGARVSEALAMLGELEVLPAPQTPDPNKSARDLGTAYRLKIDAKADQFVARSEPRNDPEPPDPTSSLGPP
jgi:hypothetical protein